jgi:antitoxin component YwqK of YwqJK toxin-antitoxin module
MAKALTFAIVFFWAMFGVKAQTLCYCNNIATNNYIDTSYIQNDLLVEYRIDRETRSKYMIKTFFTPDTHRVSYQINDSLLNDGETCGWYKSGKLKFRLLYRNDTLIGTNNFGWYENGSIQFHAINKSDTIKTMFFDQEGVLSFEEVTFGGSLLYRKLFCANGNIREFRNFSKDTVLVLEYYCSNVLKSIRHYWHSKQIGNYIEFYNDGSLKEKGRLIYEKNRSHSPKINDRKKFKKGKHFEAFNHFK